MEPITIHKAKTQLSKLIKMALRGEEVIIANGKTPVVKLVALESKLGKRKPGAWKGRIQIGPEFFEPLPSDELEPWG